MSDEKPIKNSENASEEKPGKQNIAGKFLKNVGEKGAAIGNVAGQTLQTIGGVADATGRKAGLLFASKIKNGEIADKTVEELAEGFATWLRTKKNGQVTTENPSSDTPQILVIFKEGGFLGKNYLFAFLKVANAAATALFSNEEYNGQKYAGMAVLAADWVETRSSLEKEISLFVWRDGVKLGKDNTATEYLASWLVDETGYQFEKKELIESPAKALTRPKQASLFIGREETLDQIGHTILANRVNDKNVSWIISLWGEGGAGKSYLLQQVKKEFAARMLYSQVDHQNIEDSDESLLSLINDLAQNFKKDGCPIPKFEKQIALQFKQQAREDNPDDELSGQDMGRMAKNVGKALGGTHTRNFIKQFGKTGKAASNVLGMFNVAGTLADVGFQLYDRISNDQKQKNQAILDSVPVKTLTTALVEDLTEFVEAQRKKYYLWRRPVIVLDTYELIGALADQWLRTAFLNNLQVEQLEPVIIVSGRYDIFRLNSRWTELQDKLQLIELKHFNESESLAYLGKLSVSDPERAKNLYELTNGLPLFLSLASKMSSEEAATRVLYERILEEVDPQWHQLFTDMAVPDGFNLDIVEKVLGNKEAARAGYTQLSEATFVEGRAGVLHYLPGVRRVLLRYGELESPARVQEVKAKLQ